MAMSSPLHDKFRLSPNEAAVLIDALRLYMSSVFHQKLLNDIDTVCGMVLTAYRVPSNPQCDEYRALKIALTHTLRARKLLYRKFPLWPTDTDVSDGITLAVLTQRIFEK